MDGILYRSNRLAPSEVSMLLYKRQIKENEMRLIDADELINGRVENDPVVIAVKNAPTVESELDLPPEPIQCAAMLIERNFEYETSPIRRALGAGEKAHEKYYSADDLRQIAEHLLVYCDHAEVNENTE